MMMASSKRPVKGTLLLAQQWARKLCYTLLFSGNTIVASFSFSNPL